MREIPGTFQRRIVIGAVFCVAAFALVGIRLVDVSLLRGDGRGGFENRAVTVRADLVDRNGELLARDLPVKDLYARPHVFWDKNEAAHDLAAATGANEKRLRAGFFNAKHPYVLIARQVTPAMESRVMRLGLPGLEFEPSVKRYYPDGRNAAQLLGSTDPDNNGVSGLEMGLQDHIRASEDGTPVTTSIDMRVQFILAHELATQRQTFGAHAAGGIVMDVRTGEVLAMASLPDFDPNAHRLSGEDTMRNIMSQDVYELGSVFKIFTFALALEDHTTNLDEVFQIGQGYKIGKYTIHEAERMPATLTARDILAQSSNIGTAQIALRSGGVRQKQFLAHLGSVVADPDRIAGTSPAALSRQLGRHRDRDHRLWPRHFREPAAVRGVCGGHRQRRTADHADLHQDRCRPSRRPADPCRRPAARCAICCAMS